MNVVRAGYELAARAPERATRAVGAECKKLVRRAVRAGLDLTLEELSRNDAFYALVEEVVLHFSQNPGKLFGIVDHVVEYLVHHPDVEALIHQQSATLFEGAIDDLRAGAARADTALDRVVLALRLRGKRR